MESEFWHQRWRNNQIGFHQENTNSRLTKLWPDLGLTPKDRVFVPLCGKSQDMLWLAQQGFQVFGIELSEIACEAFFHDNQLDYEISEQEPFKIYTAETITLWAGDFFALTREHLTSIAATYDRAALIALPEEMRKSYCYHLAQILPEGSQVLLISMEYDQSKMKGPPFSVVEDEINDGLEDHFSIDKVSESSGPDIVGNLAQRGLDTLTEKIFKLVRKPTKDATIAPPDQKNKTEEPLLSDNNPEQIDNGIFSVKETRILACLMEKELTVPDTYPLTIHSLVLACNQKSNREPVMKLTEGEVGNIARSLADQGYVRIHFGERAQRIGHCMHEKFDLDRQEQALLTVMMLRAPQTLNELKTRTNRMAEFSDNDDILLTLELLNEKPVKLMHHLPKSPGQREDRYTHLLCGLSHDLLREAIPSASKFKKAPTDEQNPPRQFDDNLINRLNQRIDELEQRIEILEQKS